MQFTLPKLPYAYDALEPYIDARTMEIHHTKHHQGYTDKLNAALEGRAELVGKSAEELLADLNAIPEDIRTAVRNNGGGYVNHNLFWTIMAANAGGQPSGDIAVAINKLFRSFDSFQKQFSEAAASVFGSGWAWLIIDGTELKIATTPNQDTPISSGQTPILGLDVWEHAYYLKYQNKRPDYIQAFWNVVNWPEVGRRYNESLRYV